MLDVDEMQAQLAAAVKHNVSDVTRQIVLAAKQVAATEQAIEASHAANRDAVQQYNALRKQASRFLSKEELTVCAPPVRARY